MIAKGLKEIYIEKLQLPGDMKARQKTDNVKALQTSMASVGMLHPPTVRMPGYRLLAGGDRVAARMRAGERKVLVNMIECDDDEAARITAHENLARRYYPQKTGEQLLKALEVEQKRLEPVAKERAGKKPQSSKSAKGLARESVARTRGVKPESVRRAEQRHKERQQPEKPALEKPLIDTLGIVVHADYLAKVGQVVTHMDAANMRVGQALAALTVLRQSSLPFDAKVVEGLWDSLHGIGVTLRGAIPKSICPWCKGQEGVQDDCAACQGNGYVTRVVRDEDVPKELRETGKKAMVALRGKYVLLSSIAPEDDSDPLGLGS